MSARASNAVASTEGWPRELGSGATVWALDANDTPVGQRLLWSRDLGLVDAAATFDGLSRTGIYVGTVAGAGYPLVLRSLAGGKVFVGGSDGRVHQLDLSSGVEQATRSVGSGAVVVGDPGYDNQAGRLVVNTSEGKLYAFSAPF